MADSLNISEDRARQPLIAVWLRLASPVLGTSLYGGGRMPEPSFTLSMAVLGMGAYRISSDGTQRRDIFGQKKKHSNVKKREIYAQKFEVFIFLTHK